MKNQLYSFDSNYTNYTNYIGFTYYQKRRNRIMEFTTTVKTLTELESICNDMDNLIELMVFGSGKNGEYIKVLQSLQKRLDMEIDKLHA